MFRSKTKLEPVIAQPVAAGLVQAGELERFYNDSRSWEFDREHRVDRSEKFAWRTVGVMSLITLATLGTYVAQQLRPVAAPPIIAIDKTSGNVEIIQAGNDVSKSYSELLAMFFTKEYLIAREGYQYTSLQTDYDRVLAWSSDDVGRMYSKVYEGSNSRDKLLGSNTEERIRVISVTPQPDSSTRMVIRYEKTTRRNGADVAEPPQPYIATLAFEFKPSARGVAKDLIANPLGFKVTSYRSDSELAPSGGAGSK